MYQNPYFPQYPQYPQYNPYQQQMAANQQMINQLSQGMPQYPPHQPTAPVSQGLNGKFVDSIENVKATDVMMDGSVMFFPSTDGKVIYTKQLQADGTSRVLTYTAASEQGQEENKPNITEVMEERLKAFRDDIFGGFDEINDRFDKVEKQLRTRVKESDK